MKLWQIAAGVIGGLLVLGASKRAKAIAYNDPHPEYGNDPTGYPEPPIPPDVASDWKMPDCGWVKSDLPPHEQSIYGGQWVRDSKGYWWVLVRPGV